MRNYSNTIFLILIIVLSIAIGFLFGSNFEKPISKKYGNSSINKLNKLITYLSEDYVDKINTDSLVSVVIEDIVDELDPHSVYIPAVQSESIAESMQGNFYGIGVQFRILQDTVSVTRVLEDGPSEKAGLLAGDRILIADKDTLYQKKLTSEQIVSRLKGNSTTPVHLTIYRRKLDSIIEFDIVRGPVPLPSINASYMINNNTGYIKINRFTQTTYLEFKKNILSLINQEMGNLVLDLRGNPGGYLLPAKQIADDFLAANKPIVIVEANNGKREKTISSANGIFEKGNLFILVDEDSASASEVIAGAIQDNDRGLIIGRRTFGKGLVQQQMPLGLGDQIRLTTARYFTPTGRSIQRPYDSSSRKDYYAEIHNRYKTGEMQNPKNIPLNDSLIFTTPQGRKVYGGGGITPDIYISSEVDEDELWINNIISSNIFDLFVFLELDKNSKNYNFDSAAKFFNEELPNKDEFISSFKRFSKEYSLPIKFDNKFESTILNSIKAHIALQLFNENIFYRIINQTDPFVNRAILETKK